MDFKLTVQVKRKPKRFTKMLGRIMIVFAVILVFFGIIFNRGFFFPGVFVCAPVLYFRIWQRSCL